MAETQPQDWNALADRLDALADDLIAAAENADEDETEIVTLWARGMKHYAIQLRQELGGDPDPETSGQGGP